MTLLSPSIPSKPEDTVYLEVRETSTLNAATRETPSVDKLP